MLAEIITETNIQKTENNTTFVDNKEIEKGVILPNSNKKNETTEKNESFGYLLFLIGIVCATMLHLAINPSWYNTGISYLETSILGLLFNLSNSLPFWYRVYKTRNTSSFSGYTLGSNCLTGSISLFNYVSSFGLGYSALSGFSDIANHGTRLAMYLIRWTTDILGSVIGLGTAIFVFTIKCKNFKRNKKVEHFFPKVLHPLAVVLASLICVLSIVALTIVLYFKIIKFDSSINSIKKKNYVEFRLVLFWFTTVSSCIAAIAAMPFLIKVISTRNTYSISLLSKGSLFSGMFIWTLLDYQTANLAQFDNFFPVLVHDGFIFIWTGIPIVIKLINIYKAKKLNLTEKEYWEKYIQTNLLSTKAINVQ